MSIRVLSLSSGSRGNCILVASPTTGLIIDAGIPASAIIKGCRLMRIKEPRVLITHCHCDHTSALETLSKKLKTEVYCHSDCYFSIKKMVQGGRIVMFERDFYAGDITVSPFRVSHDTPCVGYSFYHEGRKVSIVTDLGIADDSVIEALTGSDLVFIESNHDEELVLKNPNYPNALKKRILGRHGHLSNTDCARALTKIAKSGVKQVVLAHLSQENNYPQLAKDTVTRILTESGITDIKVDAAAYNCLCGIYEVN